MNALAVGRPSLTPALSPKEREKRLPTDRRNRTLFLQTTYETLTDSDFAPGPMEVGLLKNTETKLAKNENSTIRHWSDGA